MQNFSCSALLRYRLVPDPVFDYGTVTLYGTSFQNVSSNRTYHVLAALLPRSMRCHIAGLGSCAFARHYSRNHFCFLFLRVLRCFSSPGLPRHSPVTGGRPVGLPHSDICGSRDICSYPQLFAACHVLLRLREPRHPLFALLSFPFLFLGKAPLIIFSSQVSVLQVDFIYLARPVSLQIREIVSSIDSSLTLF